MSLLNDLMGQLGGSAARQIGGQLGLDESTASRAIAGALPMLIGGLTKNSQSSSGASALAGALDRDHDGSILDDLAGFVTKGPGRQGSGILGHVFGNSQPAVESALGNMSGIDKGQAGKLLAMLAPVVLGYLGRQRRSQGLDASGLAAMLGAEQKQAPRETSQAMGMVGALLDRDGDGSFVDDMGKIGAGLLGNLLSGRR